MNNSLYIWSIDPIVSSCFQAVFERNKQMRFKDEQLRQLTECVAESVVSLKTAGDYMRDVNTSS